MTIANGIAFGIATATPWCDSYGRTDERTNEEVTTPPLKSFRSVPHARISGVSQVATKTAALRASLPNGGTV